MLARIDHPERRPHSFSKCHPDRRLQPEWRDLLFPRQTASVAVAENSTDDNRLPRCDSISFQMRHPALNPHQFPRCHPERALQRESKDPYSREDSHSARARTLFRELSSRAQPALPFEVSSRPRASARAEGPAVPPTSGIRGSCGKLDRRQPTPALRQH